MAGKTESQSKSSIWHGFLKRKSSIASIKSCNDSKNDKPEPSKQQSQEPPMQSYKPRYAQRDAMRCISAKEREEEMEKQRGRLSYDKSQNPDFSANISPYYKVPTHPNYERSLSGLPFYLQPPLTRSAHSFPSAMGGSRPTSSSSARSSSQKDNSKSARAKSDSTSVEAKLQRLSLAQLKSELQAEYDASKKSPSEFDRNLDFRLAHSGFFNNPGRGAQFTPSKGKQRASDLRVPNAGYSKHKRFSPSRSASSSVLESTPEEEEMDAARLPHGVELARKSSDSTTSSESSSTANTSRQISESGTVDTEVSYGAKSTGREC